jgi:hypothetical protein
MRNLFSMVTGGILLCVAAGMSSCANQEGGGVSKLQASSQSNELTIGPETLAPGGKGYEPPWPFGPLGSDFE